MAVTLTYLATVLTLDADEKLLVWTDEHAWGPVGQRSQYSVTGALVIESTAKQAGRPITLQGGWLPRSLVEDLRAWSLVPGRQMSLLLHGVTHTVVFDHERGALAASPVLLYATPAAADHYTVTLRFLKI